MSQRTIARAFSREGVGLRSGRRVGLRAEPADAGTGRVFVADGVDIPALVEHVVDTRLTTTLGIGGARVSVVEHVCAALHAAGVDNVRLVVEGDEVPVLDGSAGPWWEAIGEVGLTDQIALRSPWQPPPLEVADGERWIRVEPADALTLDVAVEFSHPHIGMQRWAGGLDAFASQLSFARTFGFLCDADQLKAIARGASLDNTVVFDDEGVVNPGGLRIADEVVRHKVVDAIGDLALLGVPLHARVTAHRAGHALHVELVRRLRQRLTNAPS